jgi:hypothetical protein
VERIDLIEKRGKVWDANQGKAQIAHAELTTSVEESLTKELQVVDRRVREYVRQLEYQTQELAGKVERLGMEVASSRVLLAPQSTEDRTTHQTVPEQRMSTPMPTQRACEERMSTPMPTQRACEERMSTPHCLRRELAKLGQKAYGQKV